MDENKMQLINKIFNNETIRAIWDKEDEKYYISIVDKMGGHVAKVARDDIEKNLGESVVTKTNKLNYKYIEEKESKKKLKSNNNKK